MSQNEKMVEAITSINEDFTQWYTDICLKAELVDYSTVKGASFCGLTAMPSGKTSCICWTRALRPQGTRT